MAAEGGGLYAAYQTAKFLARMQDLCPNFAQHVFAVSSVSGGSLGAAVFAGLSHALAANDDAKPCLDQLADRGNFETRADAILSRDLLAPVVWGGLFPDFLQRFIPWPLPAFDRARALEYAFEESWRYGAVKGSNPLRGTLFGLCGVGATSCLTGPTPALALNVSNIETGMQMVLSPLDFTSIGPPWTGSPKAFDFFSTGVDPVDMPLSTAVGLSARFPWISPAGWYAFTDPVEKSQGEKARKRRMSFVDGGYVDNSGVATASKLAQSLSELAAKEPGSPGVEIKLIMISAAWIPFERFWMDTPDNRAQSDLFTPFTAALATWQGRGYTTQYDLAADPKPGFKIVEAGVYYNFMPLAAGLAALEPVAQLHRPVQGQSREVRPDPARPLAREPRGAGQLVHQQGQLRGGRDRQGSHARGRTAHDAVHHAGQVTRRTAGRACRGVTESAAQRAGLRSLVVPGGQLGQHARKIDQLVLHVGRQLRIVGRRAGLPAKPPSRSTPRHRHRSGAARCGRTSRPTSPPRDRRRTRRWARGRTSTARRSARR